MKTKIKAELIAEVIIGYVVLLFLVWCMYMIFQHLVGLNIFGKQSDQSTVLTNLLIWSATLYTPFLAYMAYTDWREQKNYELQKEIMLKISELVSEQFIKIAKHARKADNLKKVESEEVIISNFEEAQNCYNVNILNEIFVLLKLYENISDDKDLQEYKVKFSESSFELTTFLRKLSKEYSNYCAILEIDFEDENISRFKSYTIERKHKVNQSQTIEKILNILKTELSFYRTDEDGTDTEYKIKYDNSYDNFNKSYNDFIREVTKRMKA